MAFSRPLTTEVALWPLIKPCVNLSSPKADPETKTWLPVIYWETISKNTVRMRRQGSANKGQIHWVAAGSSALLGTLCLETGSHYVTLAALNFNIETWLALSS